MPTAILVEFKSSIATFASSGRIAYASTFFLDLPALITISILKICYSNNQMIQLYLISKTCQITK